VLLHVTDGQPADQRVRGTGLRDDFARLEIEDDGFDTLRAGIDADEE